MKDRLFTRYFLWIEYCNEKMKAAIINEEW
jgi:hypothetical protein